MTDFSRNLAEMIARSRPQQAPSPGRAPVIPGPGGVLKGKSKNVGVKATVNIDPILKWIGIMTPEQKMQALERFKQDFYSSLLQK